MLIFLQLQSIWKIFMTGTDPGKREEFLQNCCWIRMDVVKDKRQGD
jgi:hypothetical protein